MEVSKLQEILRLHSLWLQEERGGVEANLSGADLRKADLREVNLTGANLSGADLRKADLREVNLTGANLRGAELIWADLYRADLTGANLRVANLSRADLCGADLTGANLRGANLGGADLSRAILPYLIYQAYYGQYHLHTEREYIRIGCMRRTVTEWLATTKRQAVEMGLRKELYPEYMEFIVAYSRKEVANAYKEDNRNK